jgi:hypothetical protein
MKLTHFPIKKNPTKKKRKSKPRVEVTIQADLQKKNPETKRKSRLTKKRETFN